MRLFVTGDTHGGIDVHKLSNPEWIAQKNLSKNDLLVILGDFGFIWSNHRDGRERYWLKWFAEKPYRIAFLDGNHENHDRLAKLERVEFHGGIAGRVSENVWHLKRGELYKFGNKSVFTLGGAESVDRIFRTKGVSWWAGELLSEEDKEKSYEILDSCNWNVDLILTHTLPRSIIRNYLDNPEKEEDPTSAFLDQIYTRLTFLGWYAGHFHVDMDIEKFHIMYNHIQEIDVA